eukprot:4175440-Pyramimonas_sp.AAC.1
MQLATRTRLVGGGVFSVDKVARSINQVSRWFPDQSINQEIVNVNTYRFNQEKRWGKHSSTGPKTRTSEGKLESSVVFNTHRFNQEKRLGKHSSTGPKTRTSEGKLGSSVVTMMHVRWMQHRPVLLWRCEPPRWRCRTSLLPRKLGRMSASHVDERAPV